MSRGRYAKKKNNTKKWILLLVLVILLGVLIVLALSGRSGQQADVPDETIGTEDSAGHAVATDAAATGVVETENAGVQETQAPEAPAATDAPKETQTPADQTEATAAPVVSTEPPPVQIIERAEAEYEKWLAATMIVCVSMEYPDFQLEGVYAASATTLENAMDSKGAYILFTSGGQKMAIHSMPLTEERTEPGTMEISSQTLGFASFDQVSYASVDTAALTGIKLEELGELIEQSVLVTIYQ